MQCNFLENDLYAIVVERRECSNVPNNSAIIHYRGLVVVVVGSAGGGARAAITEDKTQSPLRATRLTSGVGQIVRPRVARRRLHPAAGHRQPPGPTRPKWIMSSKPRSLTERRTAYRSSSSTTRDNRRWAPALLLDVVPYITLGYGTGGDAITNQRRPLRLHTSPRPAPLPFNTYPNRSIRDLVKVLLIELLTPYSIDSRYGYLMFTMMGEKISHEDVQIMWYRVSGSLFAGRRRRRRRGLIALLWCREVQNARYMIHEPPRRPLMSRSAGNCHRAPVWPALEIDSQFTAKPDINVPMRYCKWRGRIDSLCDWHTKTLCDLRFFLNREDDYSNSLPAI